MSDESSNTPPAPPDDKSRGSHRRYNSLVTIEDARRNIARFIRKAEKGLITPTALSAFASAMRVLMDAIEKREAQTSLSEVAALLHSLRAELEQIKSRDRGEVN